MNLYELTREIELFELPTNEDGEILDEELAKELDALMLERDTKIENIALWIKNLKAEAEAVKGEKDKLQKREKSLSNLADRLKEYLSQNLNGEKFSTPKVVLSWRKSTAVEVDDTFSDERFIRYEPKISKSDIKDALKSGEIIEGARLVENNSLQIK